MRQLVVVIATWVLIYLIPLLGLILSRKIADLKYRHPAATSLTTVRSGRVYPDKAVTTKPPSLEEELTVPAVNLEMDNLFAKALDMRNYAYAPYSKLTVGAALLTENGRIFSGCNVENASYGLTMCAERIAVFDAISHARKDFKAIAIASPNDKFFYPCGACLQVMAEFSPDLDIYLINNSGAFVKRRLSKYLPYTFKLEKEEEQTVNKSLDN